MTCCWLRFGDILADMYKREFAKRVISILVSSVKTIKRKRRR
jgi:hypothetical protein